MDSVRVLLVSTYELGRQPFGLASPAAWLRDAGHTIDCVDASRQRVSGEAIAAADVVAVYLPMHTATRLAMPLIERVRRANPAARVCAFGLYAPLNETRLRASGVAAVFGGEFEEDLTRWIADLGTATDSPRTASDSARTASDKAPVPRLAFRVPDRTGLPPLRQYAALQMSDGSRRVTGYTEASRGCKHECRHCPIVPIYEGRFRIVPLDVVMADIRAQVAAGARHITFGDPDFFNGIGHALAIARAMPCEAPGVTYDVTIKIEHLLRHAGALPVLAGTGCVMVTSAVESVDDEVLVRLKKGHTRADFERAVAICRDARISLAPTFLPFTPWTTTASYLDLLRTVVSLDLVDQVAPIQLAIRLLIPHGSRMLDLDGIRRVVGPFDPDALSYPWRHADRRVDDLQHEIATIVESATGAPRDSTFAKVWEAAHRAADQPAPRRPPTVSRAAVPFLTEPWYC